MHRTSHLVLPRCTTVPSAEQRQRCTAPFGRLLHKLLVELIREDVKRTVVRTETTPVQTEALSHFITGALVGVLMWWLDGKMRLSVDEVNAYFRKLAIPALKAARA
jgi:hypothetical protein